MPNYGTLLPDGYTPRIVDAMIERDLAYSGGIEICGTRWCGKSWSALAFGNSISRIDDNVYLYTENPQLALDGDSPHVIDEWQDVPAIWNVARHRIDDNANRPGQFIMTGSSTPASWEHLHSGSGRFTKLQMHTMTLSELGMSTGKVSLTGLFGHEFTSLDTHTYPSLKAIAAQICRGGWPSLVQFDESMPTAPLLERYFLRLYENSTIGDGKNSQTCTEIARSLARNDTTAASIATIAADAGVEGEPLSRHIAESYLNLLKQNYFYYELPAWDAPVKSKARRRIKPKRYIEDPSLTASILNVNEEKILKDQQLFGVLFESLVVHDLSVYAQALPNAGWDSLYYYRSSDGLEVDCIIELLDGRWAGIEIKLGTSKADEAADNLLRLKNRITENPAAHHKEPEFLAVVVGFSDYAYQREKDGVYVMPITALGV